MRYFPLFLDLRGRPALVVGGGAVAERKIKLLIDSGARVSVVAPSLCPGLAQRLARGELNHRAGEFTDADLNAQRLVIAATDDPRVNRDIAAAAEARGLLVNVVDDAGLSSAIMPAIVDRSPLMIAISSGGTAPMLRAACVNNSRRCWISLWGAWRSCWAPGGRGSVRISAILANGARSTANCSMG